METLKGYYVIIPESAFARRLMNRVESFNSFIIATTFKWAIAYFFTGWKRYEASYLNKGEITQIVQ